MAGSLFGSAAIFYILVSLTLADLPACPEEKPDEPPAYLPDPDDCGAFYECVYGKPAHQRCPAGTYYNEKYNVCDYPENVDCGDRPINPTPITTDETPTGTPPDTPTGISTETTTVEKLVEDESTPESPSTTPEETTPGETTPEETTPEETTPEETTPEETTPEETTPEETTPEETTPEETTFPHLSTTNFENLIP